MILTNLGTGNIDKGTGLLKYSSDPFIYRVSNDDGQKIEGPIPANSYVEVTPPGKAPWTVKMGYPTFSHSATATGITSPDAVLSTIIVFPVGPNEPHIFVNSRWTAETE
jgi:hypothetical protein